MNSKEYSHITIQQIHDKITDVTPLYFLVDTSVITQLVI